MMKLGITGGIGSGKTTICSVFASLGVPIYHADEKAKNLVDNDEELRNAIIGEFGQESFKASGYNRQYIASLVFRNQEALTKLNRLIHPRLTDDFSSWASRQNSHYLVFEAAILFESGAIELMDFSVVVDAPVQLRIERVMIRDSVSKAEVEIRINNQWPADKISRMADWVIVNDDKNLILPRVLEIHNFLVGLKKSHG